MDNEDRLTVGIVVMSDGPPGSEPTDTLSPFVGTPLGDQFCALDQ